MHTPDKHDAEPDAMYKTEDGSLTLLDEESGELYHNRAGAYTEALVNFVQPLNLHTLSQVCGELAFLDVCFGLGYNTFVLLEMLSTLSLSCDFIKVVALEKFEKPLQYIDRVLSDQRFSVLNNCLSASAPSLMAGHAGVYHFKLPTKTGTVGVEFHLLLDDLRKMVPSLVLSHPAFFSSILHDPFSPKRAPELWSIDLFSSYKKLLAAPHGRVVTYSSASAVRSAFQQCGFMVRRTTAVGGKSGGTLAMLSSVNEYEECGLPLLEAEVVRLAGRAGVPYRDESFCKNSKEIVRDREEEQRLKFPC